MRELQNKANGRSNRGRHAKVTATEIHTGSGKRDTQAMERQSDALRDAMVVEIDALALKVEQLKLKGGNKPEDVAMCSHAVEEQITEVDVEITFLEKRLEEVRSKADLQKREKELTLMAHAREEQLEFKQV